MGTRPAKIDAVGSLAAAPAALPGVPSALISCLTAIAGSKGSGSWTGAGGRASLWMASLSAERAAVAEVRPSLPSDCCFGTGCCCVAACALRLAWSTVVACMSTCNRAGSMSAKTQKQAPPSTTKCSGSRAGAPAARASFEPRWLRNLCCTDSKPLR